MPRTAKPFDLDEDDFLERRPRAFVLKGLEIDPPNWALKAISKMGGHRQTPCVIQTTTYAVTPWKPFVGPPNPDEDAIFDRALKRRNKRHRGGPKGSPNMPSVSRATPAGNLREDDYRFWKGYSIDTASRHHAQCRWCAELCMGLNKMSEHHHSGYCKERLLALYRYAMHSNKNQRYCLACKKETRERRWGVPLCHTVSCWSRWKFSFNHHLQGFMQYWNWAEDEQERDPTGGPFKGLPAEEGPAYGGVPC